MLHYFENKITELKQENRYREFVDISRICGEFPYAINNANGKKITLWCSNDYLAMGQNNETIEASISSLKQYGLGSGGTRNISGTNKPMVKLEEIVANLHNKESALVFVSGYVANDATIQALAKIIPDLIIFSDEKNHASIISGINNSKLKKHVFRHNDINHLEELLKKYSSKDPKIIIFEAVYSMDGDFGEVEKISNLAKKYNALTYIDEVHAVGLYGKTGAGLCQELGLEDKIDIIQGTFAKAFGVIGGYIAGKKEIIDAIRLSASGFIFTTSLPPVITVGITQNILYLQKNDKERKQLHKNVKKVKAAILKAGIDIIKNESHIISIKIGNAKKAQEISKKLLSDFDIYVQHINYPTVAKGDERLRIITTPLHDDQMIEKLVDGLKSLIA
jgi:5-aminolevulinate synthase